MVQSSCVVLVVDAAAEDRELYRRCLSHSQNYSYTFLEASSGEEGLTLWRQQQPDVVLLDYRLADMDGLEFIASLSTSARLACPIIMVTGVGTEAIAVQAIKAGAQDYLVKDQITPERLQIAVSTAITAYQRQRQIAQEHLALQESEERFRQLAENIEMAFWVTELPERRVSYVSPAYERLWGLGAQDIYNDFKAWANLLHPDDRARVEQAFQDKAVAGKFDEEYRIFLTDGSLRWIRDRCFPVQDASGQVYRLTGIAEDITERKQTEERLRWQAQMLDQTHDSVITTDLDGCIISWNQGAERIFGYTAAEMLGRSVASLYPPGMDDFLVTQVIAPLKANGEHEVEVVNQRKSGERITILLSLSLLRDHNHAPTGMIGYSLDITERKQAERSLRRSQDRLRMAIKSADLGTWDWNLTTNRLTWDAGCKAMFGLLPDAKVSIETFFDGLHPDDRDRIKQVMQQSLDPASDGNFDIDYRTIGIQDGIERWIAAKGQAYFDAAGNPKRFTGTVLDVTERKQAEKALRDSQARYQTLFSSIDEGFCIIKLLFDESGTPTDYRFLEVNPVFETQTGLQQAVGKTVRQLVPNLEDHWIEIYGQVALTGESVRFEQRSEAMGRWFDVYASPMGEPEAHEVAMVFKDITERKRAEAQQEQLLRREQAAREAAERASRIKDEFLAVLSHELRSPLNPILGWSKLLQTRKLSDEKTAQALETIERNAKLQTQLIDDLLDVARILRGKLKLQSEAFSLPPTIAAAIDTVRTAARVKSITIHTDLPDIGQIWGDPGRIQQIVWNLLSNAIKFTPRGGRVDIRLARVDNQAQITVTDTGKGISLDFLPHIFQSFRQEDASITRQHGGLGLGLAIVHHLVEAHGGTITVDSPGEGQGATFRVKLPLINYVTESNQASPSSQNEITLTGIRVLAVDDSPDARDLLSMLFTQHQAEVMVVASAADMLAKLDTFHPDVLVCDIGMPGMDGYALMEQVRARSPEQGGQIPAIALTAYTRDLDQQQALESGYQKHISKPVNIVHLVKTIATLVETV